ncbi:uncharacterized MFS-type transporter C09D4.1-like [Cloeon dipterum]|uniref:uncharacterized MFS-type transporter C09D4.1-like n=1 Tax=Cloeon dipterum TaxID=197152 RepID=UPI0032204558
MAAQVEEQQQPKDLEEGKPPSGRGWREGAARWAVLLAVTGLVASVAAQEFTVQQHYNAFGNLAAIREDAAAANQTIPYKDLAIFVTKWALPPYVASLVALVAVLPILWIIEIKGVRVVVLALGLAASAGVLLKVAANFLDLSNLTIHTGQTLINLSRFALLPVSHRLCVAWFGPKCISLICSVVFFCDTVTCQLIFYSLNYLPFPKFGILLGFMTPHLMLWTYDNNFSQFTTHIVYPFLFMSMLPIAFSLGAFFINGEPKEAPSAAEKMRRNLEKPDRSFVGFVKRLHALFAGDTNLLMNAIGFGIAYGIVMMMFHPIRLTVLFKIHEHSEDLDLPVSVVIAACGCLGAVVSGLVLDYTRRHQLLGQCSYSGLFAFHIALVISVYSRSEFFIFFSYGSVRSFFFSAYVPAALEYAAERSYPGLESSTSGVMLATGYLVAGVFTACFGTHFADHNDATLTGYIASALLLVGLVFSAGIEESFLRRHRADRQNSD